LDALGEVHVTQQPEVARQTNGKAGSKFGQSKLFILIVPWIFLNLSIAWLTPSPVWVFRDSVLCYHQRFSGKGRI
jgi:hypothetical protein